MKRFVSLSILFLLLLSSTSVLAQSTPLEQQVGFADAKLAELSAVGQNTLGESLEFTGNNHSYRLITVWQPSPDAASTVPVGGSALLYQTDGGTPVLLWSQDYLALIGQAPYISGLGLGFFPAPPPGDWNGDGKTEFGVYGSFAGTAWFSSILYIYEIQPDNTIRPVLRGVIPAGHIVTNAEILSDNSVMLSASDIRGEMAMGLPNCCGPFIQRFFEWRGDTITDASALYPGRYFETLGNLLYYLTTTDIQDPVDYSARLLELLMSYESMGQRDAGWNLMFSLILQAKQAGRLAEGTYVDQTFLPTMTQMYQSGTPFAPPDVVAGTAMDFYSETPIVQ